jgi:hypothetical protein
MDCMFRSVDCTRIHGCNYATQSTGVRMKHYIIYTVIGMAMIEMATGDLDRMSRGVETKFARIEHLNKSLIS